MTWCSALNIYKVVSYFLLLVFVYYASQKSNLKNSSIFHCVITIYVFLSTLCTFMYKTLAHYKLWCSNYKRFIRRRYWSIIRIIDNINYKENVALLRLWLTYLLSILYTWKVLSMHGHIARLLLKFGCKKRMSVKEHRIHAKRKQINP